MENKLYEIKENEYETQQLYYRGELIGCLYKGRIDIFNSNIKKRKQRKDLECAYTIEIQNE